MNLLILILACFRITFLLVVEDGPYRIFDRLREFAGVYQLPPKPLAGQILECPYCTSLWVAFACCLFFGYNEAITVYVLLPFAVSGGAIMVVTYVNSDRDASPPD